MKGGVTAGRNYYSAPKQPGTQQIHSRYLKIERGTQLVNPEGDHFGNTGIDWKIIFRWFELAHDRDRWRAFQNAVMNFRVP